MLPKMLLLVVVVFATYLEVHFCEAFRCYLGQQPNPNEGNKLSWVLPYSRDDLCKCTTVLFGGTNMHPMHGSEDWFYVDEPWELINAHDPESLTELLGCHENYGICFTLLGSDAKCYTQTDGADYRGSVSTTETEKTCQKWTSQTPHKHRNTPANRPNRGLGDHNYCRNPDGEPRAWCYTTDVNDRWDFCDIGNPQTACIVSDDSDVPSLRKEESTTTTSTSNEDLESQFGISSSSSASISKTTQDVSVSMSTDPIDYGSTTDAEASSSRITIEDASIEEAFDCVLRMGSERVAQISTSSSMLQISTETKRRCWRAPLFQSKEPWVAISFTDKISISGIRIKGCEYYEPYVTRCQIELDNRDFGTKDYEANIDWDTPTTILFDNPVEASGIKVIATQCEYRSYEPGYEPGNSEYSIGHDQCAFQLDILEPCMYLSGSSSSSSYYYWYTYPPHQ